VPRLPAASAARAALFAGVDRLVERAGPGARLTLHRLEPVAARRLRALGREVPETLVESERLGAALALAAPFHLQRARAAVDGPLLVVKGPELAARYPDASLRIYRDLDLFAPDPRAAQRSLVAAGFAEVGDAEHYADAPHLRPLAWPGLPMELEVHERPNWPRWLAPPSAAELFEDARPSASGVDGVLAPSPERHALLVAAHAWMHGPLERARDLVDVGILAAEADPAELERLARAWRLEKLWRSTLALVEGLLLDGRPTRAQRGWARNLAALSERTVLERHVARWAGWYTAFPPPLAVRAMLDELRVDLSPEGDEGWRHKARRSLRAVRNAFVPKSEHERGG
jgi:Uncharacterised nucleotidyltransferase